MDRLAKIETRKKTDFSSANSLREKRRWGENMKIPFEKWRLGILALTTSPISNHSAFSGFVPWTEPSQQNLSSYIEKQ